MYGLSGRSRRRRRSAFSRAVGSIIGLAVAIFLLVYGGIGLGPAVSAAQGHGTRGYFVAQSESCDSHNVCTWSGEFKLPNGTVARTNVGFVGSDSAMVQGTVIAALDTGDPTSVYQADSSDQWIQPAVFLLMGVLLLLGFGRMHLLAFRRRARRPSYDLPGQQSSR